MYKLRWLPDMLPFTALHGTATQIPIGKTPGQASSNDQRVASVAQWAGDELSMMAVTPIGSLSFVLFVKMG